MYNHYQVYDSPALYFQILVYGPHSHLKSEKVPGQLARVLSSCPASLLLCRMLRVLLLRTGFRGTRSHAENFILF
jgi:hypothetical protein